MKYTQSDIEFIQAHYLIDMTPGQLAEKFGYAKGSFYQHIALMRKRGICFQQRQEFPMGTTKINASGDRKRYWLVIKTVDGWKFHCACDEHGTPKPKRSKKAKRKKQVRKPKKQVAPANPTASVEIGRNRAAGVVKTDAPRPTKHTRSRDPFNNDVNPAKVKVKQEVGGRFVQKDNRTWVYRKNVVVQ